MPSVLTASAPVSVPNAVAMTSAIGKASHHGQPRKKFISLEDECNWILSGKKGPPPMDFGDTSFRSQLNGNRPNYDLRRVVLNGVAAPGSGRRREANNVSDGEDDDTLDDISGDEVKREKKSFA